MEKMMKLLENRPTSDVLGFGPREEIVRLPCVAPVYAFPVVGLGMGRLGFGARSPVTQPHGPL